MRIRWATAALISIAMVYLSGAAPARAAHYRHFTSRVCPYSISYPTGWRQHSTRHPREDSFLDGRSPTAGVSVACPAAATGMTTRIAAGAFGASFQKEGFVLSRPRFEGGAAILTGHAARVAYNHHTFAALLELSIAVHGGKAWVLSFIADVKSFQRDLPVYIQMVSSFNGQ